jgi:hypothetical protein
MSREEIILFAQNLQLQLLEERAAMSAKIDNTLAENASLKKALTEFQRQREVSTNQELEGDSNHSVPEKQGEKRRMTSCSGPVAVLTTTTSLTIANYSS